MEDIFFDQGKITDKFGRFPVSNQVPSQVSSQDLLAALSNKHLAAE
ncbi:MAG: hypothetical protein ACOYMG_16510 [Candidatus Methylumidiphilus sp.]